MQQPKSKFWIVSGLPDSLNDIDVQSIRHQITDVNWVNIAKIKENASILCFRFSVQLSISEVSERLTSIFSNDLDLENYLHIAETVHTTPEQKNIYVCHLPRFLHDEKKLRTLVNSFVKKVIVIDNCEYMTIRCQSCQNSSLAATFLRSIPAECLTDDNPSNNNPKSSKNSVKGNAISADSHRVCFGRKLTVELSVSQLPIALLFKVNKEIMDYENGIPTLTEIRKEGIINKDFTVTRSHIASPCMQVLAITASSLHEIDYIIDKLTDAGFTTKRCLSVPQQEEIEKYEIIIENVQQKTIHELRQRIQREFNASIYEARIIASGSESNERNDALIIFYDFEDAMKVVQTLQNEKEHARLYRTTALLHNLPIDITSEEVKDYISHLTDVNENVEFMSEIDNIEIFIHQYSFNKSQIKQQPTSDFDGGSYAEIKFPSIELMQKFIKHCSISEKQNDEKTEKVVPPLRGVFIPFACETKRGRYKREVFYEKTVNSIVKENTIRVFGCTTNDALAIVSKGGFPLLYFGRIEDDNERPKVFTKKTPNVSARMKALMTLSGVKNQSDLSNNNNDVNDNDETPNNDSLLSELLITFCSKEDMRKAAGEFRSKEFNCDEFDSSILQGNSTNNNEEENEDNGNSNNKNKLVNPFISEREDQMKFINEPAPQQQQKMTQRPNMNIYSNQIPMRTMQRVQSSKFNKKDSSRQNHTFVQKNISSHPYSRPPRVSKANSNS